MEAIQEPKVCRMIKPLPENIDDESGEREQVADTPPAKQIRRVAICGTSETTAHLAPTGAVNPDGSPMWEIWTLGTGYKRQPRSTLHFQLHNLDEGAMRWSDEYKMWLNKTTTPIMLQKLRPEWIPSGVQYPLEQVIGTFPSGDYLTCMIAQMIAFAILQKVDEIGIYGCDLAADPEYYYQRPAVEYWIGLARGMGVKVHIPETSDLLKCAEIYGYQTHGGQHQSSFSRCLDARIKEIEARQKQHEAEMKKHERAYWVLTGAHESSRYTKHWLRQHSDYTGRDYVMEETAIAESDGCQS